MTQDGLGILRAGDVGVIDSIVAPCGTGKRLADMGFVRGARVEMVRPGAPCIVRLDATCVGLGQAHQTSIRLSPA